MTTAIVRKVGDKFACSIDAKVLGTSKHPDYFELHLRQGDVKVLKEAGITKIEYVDEQGAVTSTVDTTVPYVKKTPKAAAKPVTATTTEPTAPVKAEAAVTAVAETTEAVTA